MADLKQEYRRKNSFWRNWGAVIILVGFFLASWAGQFVNQLITEKQDAQQHGQQFDSFLAQHLKTGNPNGFS
jgi:type II secretory pathway component PulL